MRPAYWRSARWQRPVWVVLGVFALGGATLDVQNTMQFGAADLRSQVVGARRMAADEPIYSYKWRPGDSPTYADPADGPRLPYSRVSTPPTVLAIHAVGAGLPYRVHQGIWLLIQWG